MSTPSPLRTSPTSLRPLSAEQGLLKRSDGSSTFSFGPLSVLASLLGPTEVRIRDELTDQATLDVRFQPLSGVAALPSTSLSTSFHTMWSSVLLLHHHPRTMIQLSLQTTSAPPSAPPPTASTVEKGRTRRRRRRNNPLFLGPDTPPSAPEKAALVNAASLALLDAGIPARGTVAACSCAVLRRDEGSVLRNAGGAVLSEAQVRDRSALWRIEEGLSPTTEGEEEEEEDETEDTIILLDPTPTELSYALSTHVFAYSFSGFTSSSGTHEQRETENSTLQSEQVYAESLGLVSLEDRQKASLLCRQASQSIYHFIRQATAKRVAQQASMSPSSLAA